MHKCKCKDIHSQCFLCTSQRDIKRNRSKRIDDVNPPSCFCVPPSLPPPPELSLALPEEGFRQLPDREKMKDCLSALWTGCVFWLHLPQPTTESWFKENMAWNISYAWNRPNKFSDKSLCLDLTLAVHRRVHTEAEGKTRQKWSSNHIKWEWSIVYRDI